MTIRVGIYDNKFKDIFPENQINAHSAYHIGIYLVFFLYFVTA